MKRVDLLTGKWQFIGVQIHDGEIWRQSDNNVDNISWEFQLHCFSRNKGAGLILERSAENPEPILLDYFYDAASGTLHVEMDPSATADQTRQCEARYGEYEVMVMEHMEHHDPTSDLIVISRGFDATIPLRYILQKI
ncbi:MAG: hypothetical protein R3Y44_00945 [Rikenellaceae bacterium]